LGSIIILNLNFESKLPITVFSLGVLCAIVCIFGWSLESVISAFAMNNNKIDSETVLIIREATSFITYGLIIIPFVFKGYGDVLVVFRFKVVLLLILTALIGVLSYLSWYKSIESIGVSRAISFNITYSFWVILINGVLSGGIFSLKMIISCFLIVGGVSLAVGKPRKL